MNGTNRSRPSGEQGPSAIVKKPLSRTNSISKADPNKANPKHDYSKATFTYNPPVGRRIAAGPATKPSGAAKEPDTLQKAMDEQANKTASRWGSGGPVGGPKPPGWTTTASSQASPADKKPLQERVLQPSQSLPVDTASKPPIAEDDPKPEAPRPTKIAGSLSLQTAGPSKETKSSGLKVTKRETPEVSQAGKVAVEPKANKPTVSQGVKLTKAAGMSALRPASRKGTHDEYLAMILQQEEMELNEQLFMIEMMEERERQMQRLCPDGVDPDRMTYEEMLEMQERVGKVTVGLSPAQFKMLQREKYSPKKHSISSCCVCLNDFEPDQEVVRLRCEHIFDSGCLERWTKENKCCPICKGELETYHS